MQEFVDWWLHQLIELLPAGLKEISPIRSVAAVVEIDDDEAALSLRQQDGITQLARASADRHGFAVLADRAAEPSVKRRHLVLRLPPTAVLRKRLSFPPAARSHLDSLLAFELERETPFARDELYWSYTVCGARGTTGRIDIDLVICPRSAVDPVLRLMRDAGLHPDAIEFESADEETMVLPLDANRRGEGGRSLKAMAALAGVLAIVAVATPFVRQQRAISSADAAIATLTKEAEEAGKLRQSVDRAESAATYLAKMHRRFGSPLETMAETTRLLQDDTYLTSVDLRDGKLTITGRAPSTARIVDALSNSTLFGEPSFQSPVVENGGSDLESFTISVTLKSGGAS